MNSSCYRSNWLLTACLLAAASLLAGCVQRRMMIATNPPGAVVYLNDVEIGQTPIATDFTYYGTQELRIVKDGYQTLTVDAPVPPPWYQIPPLDFVTDNFIPGTIHDSRSFQFDLQPRMMVPRDELLGRAEQLRGQHAGAPFAPAGQLAPPQVVLPPAAGQPAP